MPIKITLRPDLPLGTWQGIGGALTEATAYNFSKLSPKKQQKFLDAYYGKDGLDYHWVRLSIGSNDFCLEPFEYTKKRNLSDFSITHDKKWLLPMLKTVLAKKSLKIVAAPWSPPRCLKLLPEPRHGVPLAPWNYQRYAKYLKKWLDAYAAEGININYLSPQNEPHAAQKWESCFYSFRAQRRLAYKYLAPMLKDYKTQLLLWDHNKKELPKVADQLLRPKNLPSTPTANPKSPPDSNSKIAGLCFHWYDGTCPDEMWQVRQNYPNAMLVSSEMCCGFSPYDEEKWANAAKPYYYELFSDINSGASAFIDWNMLLSWHGGPSYCKNYVTSPILLNASADDFILTPIYHALKKFAHLFPAGSEVVRCDNPSDQIAVIARKLFSNSSRSHPTYEALIVNVSDDPAPKTVSIQLTPTAESNAPTQAAQTLSLKPLELRRLTFQQ